MKTKLLITTLVLSAAATLLAQENHPPQANAPGGARPAGNHRGGPPGGQSGQNSEPGMPGGQRPSFPLVNALDGNKDHVIDVSEMANAAAALKALDKNGDGKLTPDEYMPKRPAGPGPDSSTARRPGQSQGHPPSAPQ